MRPPIAFACFIAAGSVALATTVSAAPCAGFGDVDTGNSAYCAAVTYLKSKGITTGCGDGSNYCPNDYVTRLQMALFLQRMGKGGSLNTVGDVTTTVSGGGGNVANETGATVGGGLFNSATAEYATVPGGDTNKAEGEHSTVGGGSSNRTTGADATIAGGSSNYASGSAATIGGGFSNRATGAYATVPGGRANDAAGNYSFAAGRRAKANATGSFAFADSNDVDFESNTSNTFRVRATNGVRFVVGIDGDGATTWSCLLTDGSSWSCSSDRNQKQDFVELDGGEVLDRLSSMPVYAWSPKGANANLRHYGPTAQDFHAAFGLGDSDIMIGQQDADGVALAAIKGLHGKVVAENAELKARLGAMEARLAELEAAR